MIVVRELFILQFEFDGDLYWLWPPDEYGTWTFVKEVEFRCRSYPDGEYNLYSVNPDSFSPYGWTCTCPQNRVRYERCRHMMLIDSRLQMEGCANQKMIRMDTPFAELV